MRERRFSNNDIYRYASILQILHFISFSKTFSIWPFKRET